MHALLGALAAIIFAYLAGQANHSAKAALAFNALRSRFAESVREIAAMDSASVDNELAGRLPSRASHRRKP